MVDTQELKPGLTIFRRADLGHRDWYSRIKLPKEDRYETTSLKTADINEAKDKAFEQDADLRFRVKHEVPIFNRPFSEGRVSDGTIRDEMNTFRSIMTFAAGKRYIPESHVPKGKLPVDKVAREEFTPEEYRKLHTFARGWIEESRNETARWSRSMAYNFMLIMTNTGMRPSEARNLRWRDVSIRTDKQGRRFVILSVRGKGKHRDLVATSNVADYLGRVRAPTRHSA
jgi:integrase